MVFGRLACAAAVVGFLVSSAAAEPRAVLAATETESAAVVAPAVSDSALPRGHQASDAALEAAIAEPASNGEAKAEPLAPPEPTLFADIDLANQVMTVSDASGELGRWKISSARGGYVTPTGTFRVNFTARMHYSKQYHWSPMPYSVFFTRGVAVHGTHAVGRLGHPASHGCVRLHTKDAKIFYNLVQKHGEKLTQIVVHGKPPYTPAVAERSRPRYREPAFQPFGFFAYEAPSYNPGKRRYRRQRYGGSYDSW
jgi:lipoprotein-anchoring transpeptidase ErfK/SrfK